MSGLMTGWRRPGPPERPSAIAPSLMRVVENVLGVAWRVLLEEVSEGLFSICDAEEDEITARLYNIICEMHAIDPDRVRGFSLFETPIREGNISNHDDSHPDRQPDLTFRLLRGHIQTTNSALAGIFVECKPIDSRHSVSGAYCKEGLVRFIRGDYAWAVDRALMVAYVRNHCLLPDGLLPCIHGDRSSGEFQFQGEPIGAAPTDLGDAVYQTLHARIYPLAAAQQAGPITLHHLWLFPAEACEDSTCRGVKTSFRAPFA